MSKPLSETAGGVGGDIRTRSRYMAEQLCLGFWAHDNGDRETSVASFANVDRNQFAHLDDDEAELAAESYVDALWRKDEVEFQHLQKDGFDRENLEANDWSPVKAKFRQRAAVVGMDPEYADYSTLAWKRHKTGGDYWTPIQQAQAIELRAALRDPAYPDKPKHGQSGFGPEPARYALSIELHDMHDKKHYKQGVDVMTPYFERILEVHVDD